jgi:calcium permeable stress-gated cation channel
LNGVLPEPWLPLKKGQTLANHDRSSGTRASKDSNQAVVLTLRKRYSVVRKSTRSGRGPVDHLASGIGEGLNEVQHDGAENVDPTVSNPWQDARPGRPRDTEMPLSHRLSFDHGSGVIVLPEDAEWLTPDPDSDSEDDYLGASGLENSQPELSTSSEVADTSPLSPSKHRYGTYYHHPERM